MHSLKKIHLLFLLIGLNAQIVAQGSIEYTALDTELQNESIYCKEFEEVKDRLGLTLNPDGEEGKLVAIASTDMPILYAYIQDICEQHGIRVPFIYITLDDSITDNAAARTDLIGQGTILINPREFKQSHKAFEASMAHELGHIKYRHTHKLFLIAALYYMTTTLTASSYLSSPDDSVLSQLIKSIAVAGCSVFTLRKWVMPFVARKFEQQADEFAYKDCNEAEGFIECFSPGAQAERELRDLRLRLEDYNNGQYQAYTQNTSFTRRVFHAPIILALFIIKSIDDGVAWLIKKPSHHPTHEERVEAVLNYVASQQCA